ncbi:MAG TPA: hypothetical protein VF234_02035 [Limnochordia bacterium]
MVAEVRGITLSRLLVGGALAGLAQAMAVYVCAGLLGAQLGGFFSLLAQVARAGGGREGAIGGLIVAAMALVWAGVYAVVRDGLPGGSGWGRGLLFGLGIWLLGAGLLVPALGWMAASTATPGLFGLGFGTPAALTALIAHAVYGIVLGAYLAH